MTFAPRSLSIFIVSRWLEQWDKKIREKKLFRDGQSLLVAVSGGIDSMVLLRALHSLAEDHKWKIKLAHFNHHLRGASSDADELFVRNAAERLDLRVVVGDGDVRRAAKEKGLSLEMAARELRHSFLAQAARKQRIGTIALAHHADDQVELFFLRLLRGAGGEGLAGMKWISPSPADPRVFLARPFLNATKEDLRAFAREQGVEFREDASNRSIDIQRNRIRHQLIPMLKDCQEEFAPVMLRTMEILCAEAELAGDLAAQWLKCPGKAGFQSLPIAVQRRVVQSQLIALKQTVDFEIVERLRQQPGQWFMTRPEISARQTDGAIQLRHVPPVQFCESQKNVMLKPEAGTAEFAGLRFSWKSLNQPGKKFSAGHNVEYFDAGKVGRKIRLRHWVPGDRFHPIGAASPRKLQDLFTDLKVPRAERHKRVLAATSTGEIFWVQGLRIGEQFKLTESTATRLEWSWTLAGKT